MRIRQVDDDDVQACLPDGVEPPTAGPADYLWDERWSWLLDLGGEQARLLRKRPTLARV